jgi:hypothetical protein
MDSLAEQGEFELPVPSSEQPDDNIMSRSALLSRVARGFNAWSAYRDEQNRVTGESTIGVGLEFERIPLCARIGRQTRAECHRDKEATEKSRPRVRIHFAPPATEESSHVESVPPPADLQLAPNPRNVEN